MTQKEPDRPEPDVVLEGIVGSTAYGLATAASDVDRRGIFLEPPASFLRLGGFPIKKQSWNGPKSEGDRELTEVGKFCSLVLGGNPTYTELLWLPDDLYLTRTAVAHQLIEMREDFLSARAARDSYFGYATQQFKKLKDRGGEKFSSDTGNRTEKHARHMARLLFQGYNLWAFGRIVVKLPPRIAAQVREFGEQVAEEVREFGDRVAKEGSRVAKPMLNKYEEMFERTPTVLPAEPNREKVDKWLINLRLTQARQN